jgi:hypothetical protein
MGGRTVSQGMFGGIALVLGIVGLAITRMHPGAVVFLDAVAQIALGVAVIVFGMALSGAYLRVARTGQPAGGMAGPVTGTTADMFLGGAVVILGVLALLSVATEVLISVAVIVVGTGLLLNSAASARAVMLEAGLGGERSVQQRVGEELVLTTASARAVAGLAMGVLGILSLMGGADAMMLTLTAAIIGGAAMLLASTSLSHRLTGGTQA